MGLAPMACSATLLLNPYLHLLVSLLGRSRTAGSGSLVGRAGGHTQPTQNYTPRTSACQLVLEPLDSFSPRWALFLRAALAGYI
eukprot:359543-Chlamydomonas_euryale.AAC.2